MIVVTLFSTIAFLLTLLDSKKLLSGGMRLGFFITGFIAVIHYNYGNDYMVYYSDFISFMQRDWSLMQVLDGKANKFNEIGWGLIYYTFSSFGRTGFFMIVGLISVFEAWVYYNLINKYVAREWWWLAVFVYLFTPGFYVYNFSMLRQGFVIAGFVSLFDIIKERKWFIAVPIIFLLTRIHTSANILYPFAFAGFLPVKKPAAYSIFFIVGFIACFLSVSIAQEFFDKFMQVQEFATYAEVYKSGKNSTTTYGIGFVINLLPFLVALLYLTKKGIPPTNALLVIIACVGSMTIPFAEIMPQVSRISLYFTTLTIATIPITYAAIKQPVFRAGLIGIYMFITCYGYVTFFAHPVWTDHFSTYHTILEAI